MRRVVWVLCGLLLVGVPATGRAAGAFADPAFERQWNAGERVTANFWGPLATAKDGQQEPYGGATRTVQYFDKGRMEQAANGTVTSGLLATELVRGQVQTGDATFAPRPPPAIPVAGDPNGGGPTYAQIAANAATLIAPAASRTGRQANLVLYAGRAVTVAENTDMALTLTEYDAATGHNVLEYFALARSYIGLPTLGLAVTEPFICEFRVGGMTRAGVVQVFERRVLTLDPKNPPTSLIEFGNIGQHYYQWRYPPAASR